MALNLNNTELVMTAGLQSQFPTDKLPQIALSGRSNVGKSSLLNRLVGRKSLARVSGSPGVSCPASAQETSRHMAKSITESKKQLVFWNVSMAISPSVI